jgi:Icc-related predicted phosphoesterase
LYIDSLYFTIRLQCRKHPGGEILSPEKTLSTSENRKRKVIMKIHRRDFLKLFGMGSAVLVLGTPRFAYDAMMKEGRDDFLFIQVSDTHWGFNGPSINPDATGTLKKAISAINSMNTQPDFVVFTGDITHTTDDPKERRKRMAEARDIIAALKVKDIKFMPGEHDAALDNGEAFQEFFGKTHYTFDHKGVHFIAVDNVSDQTSSITEPQLQWLSDELKKIDKSSRIVVLTHRPLFDLYPQWDWWTRDGAKAIDLLLPYKDVTVFYGHIHQEHHQMTGHIPHHAAKGMMFPLPAPGSAPKRAPIPWDPAHPYKGIGYRSVEANTKKAEYKLTEYALMKG